MHNETNILKRREMDEEMARRQKVEGGGAALLFASAMNRDMERDLQDSGHLFALMIKQIEETLGTEENADRTNTLGEAEEKLSDIRYWVERAKALFPPNFPRHDDVHMLDAE
jgi:hypothetical protein